MNLTRIYLLVDDEKNIRYVGKTELPLEKRFRDHLNDKSDTYKSRWIKSLLRDNKQPTIISVARVPFEEWEFWERHFIEYYRSIGCRLTNTTNGGEYGGSTGPRSASFRRKRSNLMKNNPVGAGNHKGHHHSQLSKEHISFARTGVQHTDETKKILSEKSSKPRNFTDAQKEKMSFGKELSRKKRKVYQLTFSGELVEIWESRALAQKYFHGIEFALTGRQRSAHGFAWFFETDLVEDNLHHFSEKYNYELLTLIHKYSLECDYISTHTLFDAKTKYGCDVLTALTHPSTSVGGYFWRFYKQDRINLYQEVEEHKQGKFNPQKPEHTSNDWDNIINHYKTNNTLEGYVFKPAPDNIHRYNVKSERSGRSSLAVVVKDKSGNVIETFAGVKLAEKKYTWRVGEYLKGTKIHPALDFVYQNA